MRRLVARYHTLDGPGPNCRRTCMIGEIDSEYEDEEYGTMYRVRLLTEDECAGLEPGDAAMVYGDPARQARGRQYWHAGGCREILKGKSPEEIALISAFRRDISSPLSMRDHRSELGLKHGALATYPRRGDGFSGLKMVLHTSYDSSTGMLGIGIDMHISWALLSALVDWFREYADCMYVDSRTEPGDIHIYAHNERFWLDIQIKEGGEQ